MNIEKLVEFSRDGEKNIDGLDLIKGFPSKLQPARQWFNWIFNNLTLKVNEVIDAINNTQDDSIGLVSIFPHSKIPSTHIKCNGAIYKKTDYPKLFSKLGSIYGGDGVNTFAVPDYRGIFLRGLDENRELDSGRVLGGFQEDDIKAHTHEYMQVREGGAGQTSGGSSNYNTTVETSKTGGKETRPKNVSVIFAIKAL